MTILDYIRAIFKKKTFVLSSPGTAVPFSIEEYLARRSVLIEEKSAALKAKYGADFNSFFYQRGFDEIIRFDVLPFIEENERAHCILDNDYWREKHPFNFPGPFYTGDSDTCGTGDVEAPENVMYDSNYREYIFKQPSSFAQLFRVIDAAAVEVLDSYSCNGNMYWTYELCKEWWRNKSSLITQLNDPEVKSVNGEERVRLYIDYLNSDAQIDLRRYCFFLENGRQPEIYDFLPEL